MHNVNNIQLLSHQISSFDNKAFFSGDNKKYALIAAVVLAIFGAFAATYYLFKKYYPQKINASPVISQNKIKALPSGLQNHVSAPPSDSKKCEQPDRPKDSEQPNTQQFPKEDSKNIPEDPKKIDDTSADALDVDSKNKISTPPSVVKKSELADLFNDWEQAISKQTSSKLSEITSALQKKIEDASVDTLNVDNELDVLSKINALTTQTNNTDLRAALDALVQRWFDENSKKGAGIGARFATIVEKLQPCTLKSELIGADIDIIKQAKSLTSINCGIWVNDERLGNLVQSCPWIERLFLHRSRITDAGLAHLKKLNALKELDLHFMAQITDQSLAQLQGLTALQILNLEKCERITDQGLSHIQRLTTLQQLNLEKCSNIGDGGLTHLQGLIALQYLNLRGCSDFSDNGLYYLRGLTSLQDLRLFHNSNVTDHGLVHLKGLTALRRLELNWFKNISGRGLAQLQGLTGLEYLDLSSCERMTDDDLVYLKGLTSLKKLRLVFCNEITVKGKKHLKGLKGLKDLVIV